MNRNEDFPLVRQERSLPGTAWHTLAAAWNPRPVPRPSVDPDLPDYPSVTRTAEVLRYHMLMLEHALSRGGGLRAWLKLNLLIGLVLAAPALLVVPVVTLLLSGVSAWSVFLLATVRNLTLALLWGVLFVIILVTFAYAVGQCRASRR